VSHDLPLARPAGTVTTAPVAPAGTVRPGSVGPSRPAAAPVVAGQPDLEITRFRLWEGYFAVMVAGTGAIVAIGTPPALPARAGALALLAALVAWYLGYGRSVVRAGGDDWRGYVYLAGAFALYVPAVILCESTSFALFALCPQVFMVLPTLPAIGVVVLFNAVHIVVLVVRVDDLHEVTPPLLIAAMVVVVVSVIGTWSQQVATESAARAALIRELDSSRTEVARLSHQAGIGAERQRLAGEIHDTIAQGLSSVVMLIQAAEADLDRDPSLVRKHLRLAAGTARENLAEARGLVEALTPGELTGSPLAQALDRVVMRFRAETGLPATFTTAGPERPLATSIEVVLLRAAQESLANVRKHAAATSVSVELEHRASTVALQVRDDGRGFAGPSAGDGFGLGAMRTRVEQVAGTLSVDSGPGHGTTVRVEVPLP
jgi:signal transduction histidine kinase